MSMFSGTQVIESVFIPEFKEVHRQERKWAHRVMWNRNQRFKIKSERVVLLVGGVLHAHPNTAKIIYAQIAKAQA
ncbi:hypothetical protein ACRS34_09580 [Stutzerimonas stutzeri]|uniref:hypothetical protein n=1 Tax=Stutzerimonas stutzeri TaxID=316 RepID=UPI003EE1EE08